MIEIFTNGGNIPEALHRAAVQLNDFGGIQECPAYSTKRKEVALTLYIEDVFAEPCVSKLFTFGGKEELDRYLDICMNGVIDNAIGSEGLTYTYHQRLFTSGRFQKMIDQLKADPYTTRACCSLRNDESGEDEKDPPCFSFITLRNIDDQLHCKVIFRSWDFANAAVLNIFFIREIMKKAAAALSLSVGPLTIRAESAHVYEKYWPQFAQQVSRICTEPTKDLSYLYDEYFI